jgi:hypothetical protein
LEGIPEASFPFRYLKEEGEDPKLIWALTPRTIANKRAIKR